MLINLLCISYGSKLTPCVTVGSFFFVSSMSYCMVGTCYTNTSNTYLACAILKPLEYALVILLLAFWSTPSKMWSLAVDQIAHFCIVTYTYIAIYIYSYEKYESSYIVTYIRIHVYLQPPLHQIINLIYYSAMWQLW